MRIALAIALVVVVVVALAGSARAECTVTIKGATPHLRSTLARRVVAERCTSMAIELAITDRGAIHVVARFAGQVHRRIVPDIEAAGTLVARWALEGEPITAPARSGCARTEPCSITIKGGTRYLRERIAHWVTTEPRCTSMAVELDITDHGDILVSVRLASGRLHQRLVPEIETAGALVASWGADAHAGETRDRTIVFK